MEIKKGLWLAADLRELVRLGLCTQAEAEKALAYFRANPTDFGPDLRSMEVTDMALQIARLM